MTAALYVYWCPRCQVQSERPYHFCERGPALIPQLDVETLCERIAVVPAGASSSHDSQAAVERR